FAIHLNKRNCLAEQFDLQQLSVASEGFSGSEIEQAIVAALYNAAAQARTLDTQLLLQEIASTSPLSVVMAEQINQLRLWAADRTSPACNAGSYQSHRDLLRSRNLSRISKGIGQLRDGFHHHQRLTGLDSGAFVLQNLFDFSCAGRGDVDLHLHGLQDQQQITRVDFLSRLDLRLPHAARHGAVDTD